MTLGHRWNFRHMGEALGTLFRVGITGEYADVCSRMLTYAHVCSRMALSSASASQASTLTYAHVC